MRILVQLKQAGKRKNKIEKVPIELEAVPVTVQELIEYSVHSCVKLFEEKRDKEPQALSEEELEDKASSGKIAFGFFYGNAEVNESKAKETAIQAFEDGIVVVFVDGIQKEKLIEEIVINEESVVTFVKLALLSGRLR